MAKMECQKIPLIFLSDLTYYHNDLKNAEEFTLYGLTGREIMKKMLGLFH